MWSRSRSLLLKIEIQFLLNNFSLLWPIDTKLAACMQCNQNNCIIFSSLPSFISYSCHINTWLNQVNNDIIFAWQSRIGHANECQLFLQKLVSECKYWSLNCNNYICIAMLCFRQAPVLCNRGPTPNSPDSGHTPHSFIILHGI